MPPTRQPADEAPSESADSPQTRIARLERELAERAAELDALRAEAALAEHTARARLAAAQSDLRSLRADFRALYARRGTRFTYLADGVRARVAPWGTRRGQAARYLQSAASVGIGALAQPARKLVGPALPDAPERPARPSPAPAAPADAPAAVHAQTGTPLVSVIMPVYNAERADGRYLAEALESVAAQTYRAFELIIVDDGSTDGSAALVERFFAAHPELDAKLLRQENGGQSSARNAGARDARGDWLAFLDQDDVWTPAHLRTVWPELVEGVGLVYTDADIIDEDDRLLCESMHGRYGWGGRHPKTTLDDVLFEDICVMPGLMTVRRSLFEQVGGFDERLSGCEDDDLYLRVMQAGRVSYVPVATLAWRHYADSYGLSRRMIDSRLVYWRTLVGEYAGGGRDVVPARRISLRFLYVFLVEGAERLEHGRPLTADYLEAARELLPHVGAVDRASFCLVEWAWRRQSRPAHYARIWFLHGLEPAQPYASRLELPEEVAPR